MNTLYSISDSSHWANKADLGLIIHADDPKPEVTKRRVIVPKVKHSGLAGMRGECCLDFDTRKQLFIPGEFDEIDPMAEPHKQKSRRRE